MERRIDAGEKREVNDDGGSREGRKGDVQMKPDILIAHPALLTDGKRRTHRWRDVGRFLTLLRLGGLGSICRVRAAVQCGAVRCGAAAPSESTERKRCVRSGFDLGCQESMGQAQQSLCCEKIPTQFHTQRPTPKAQLHAPGQPAAITKGYAKYLLLQQLTARRPKFPPASNFFSFSSASFQLESNNFFSVGVRACTRSQEPGADSVDQPSNR